MYPPALALCLLCAAPVAASTTIPPILVSASRTLEPGAEIAAANVIITRAAIAESGARELAELLRSVPGIRLSDASGGGGSANVDMRGFGGTAGSNVAILVNGRKINPASDSATLYLNTIDLDSVEQIEIVHGSAGVLYGNQAVGGLINVITRRGRPGSRQLRLGTGSYAGWEVSAEATEALGDQVSLQLRSHRRDSANYRDNNRSRVQRLDARLEFDHGTGDYSHIELQDLRDDLQTPGALLRDELDQDRRQAIFDDDFFDTHSRVIRLGSRRQLHPLWRFEGEVAWRRDRRDFVQSFRGFPGAPATQARDIFDLSPRLVGRIADNLITLGADHLATDYRLSTALGPQHNDQQIDAIYAQINRPLSSAVSASLGLRRAWVRNRISDSQGDYAIDDAVSVGSAGLVYRPEPDWRLFARLDQNYRFAKVDEHTNVVFGQAVSGLDTQRGTSYEIGAEYAAKGLELAARAYELHLEDEISFDALSFANINISRSSRKGLALSAALAIQDGLRLGGGYAYTDARITRGPHAGSRVPLVARHSANLFLEYRPGTDSLIRLDTELVGRRFLGGDFTNQRPSLDGYSVTHLSAQHTKGPWRFSLRVNNLFDEDYLETGATSFAGDGFTPAPDRNLWIGVSYQLED